MSYYSKDKDLAKLSIEFDDMLKSAERNAAVEVLMKSHKMDSKKEDESGDLRVE